MTAGLPQGRHGYYLAAWLAVSAIVVLSGFLTWKQRQEGYAMAENATLNTARVLSTQVESSFDQTDALLLSVGQRYADAWSNGDLALQRLITQVRREIPSHPMVSRVGIVDERGDTVFNSGLPAQNELPVSLSDRDYVQRALSGEKQLIFAGPLQGKRTREWSIILARRIDSDQGKLVCTVFAVLPVSAFLHTFSHVAVGRSGSVSMRTTDLTQVARYPQLVGEARDLGNRTVSQTIRELMRTEPGRDNYVYKTTAPIDGTERVYAYQKLGHSPFWISVGQATADFETGWRQTAVLLAVLSLGMAAFLAWGARQLTRQRLHLERRLCETKAAEAALRQSEQRFRHLFHESPLALCFVDPAGVLADRNRRFDELFGYSHAQLRTLNDWWTLAYPDPDYRKWVLATWEAAVERAAREHTDIAPVEYRVTSQDGTERLFLISGITLDDCFLATFFDVTDRRLVEDGLVALNAQLEARVAQRTEDLQRSNQELDEFTYIASHDLKEPLRGIHNYATFLQEDYAERLDEQGRAYLERMQRLVVRQIALLDRLLAFSRIGHGELQVEPVDLDRLLDNVVEDLATVLDHAGVELRRPQPLPVAVCNTTWVGEVFQNLIANAVKYNDKPSKWVEVGVDASVQPPVFHVRDNGIGIAPQHQEAVFRIFKRLHGQNDYGGGPGAGQTNVKKIIQKHGGRIWLESPRGQGTSFYFTLQGAA